MNILFAHDIHFIGGGELWAMRVGEQLLRRGHRVRYATPPDSAFGAAIYERGLEGDELPFYGLYDELIRAWRETVDAHAIDVIVCSVMGYHREAQLLSSLAGAGRRPALVLKSGTLPMLDDKDYGADLEQYLDGLIVVSPKLRDMYVGYGIRAEFVTTMWEGVDLRRLNGIEFVARNPRFDIRRVIGVASDVPLIMNAGRLEATKGQHVLVRALREVKASVPAFCCVIFGVGPDLGELREAVEANDLTQHVFFAGYHDLFPFYAQADLVVQSSFGEGLSNVVLEAMAAGCAVVATDVGGTADAVVHGERGALVPAGEAEALAHELSRLLLDHAEREQLGANAATFIRTELDAERTVVELESYLRNVIDGRAQRGPFGATLSDGDGPGERADDDGAADESSD